MSDFFESLKSNLSNVFSLIGILLTIYFSIFYVPQYANEIEQKKIESTHEALMDIIQELVYNNHNIDSKDLETLIRSNELSKKVAYPYSIDELLIQVQGEFINNKFIPLEQRKVLVEKIDLVRESIPNIPPNQEEKKEGVSWIVIASYLASSLGVLLAGLGLSSTWKQTKELKDIELQSTLEDTKESIKSQLMEIIALEETVFDAIKDIPDIKHVTKGGPNNPVDLMIKTHSGARLGIEAKYTETGIIPLKTANTMIGLSGKVNAPLLLVANAPLSRSATKKLEEYNNENKNTQIEFININKTDDLAEYIKESVYKYT